MWYNHINGIRWGLRSPPFQMTYWRSNYKRSTLGKRRYNAATTRRRLRRWRSINLMRARFLRNLDEYRTRLHEGSLDTLRWMEWLEILKSYNFSCSYCGSNKSLQLDHIHPLSRGGDNTKQNVRPACGPCNKSKGSKLLSEWKPEFTQSGCNQAQNGQTAGAAADTIAGLDGALPNPSINA